MSREYEAVYIFDSALEDTAINDKLTRFHGLLHADSDIKTDHWGRRQLAYKIGTKEGCRKPRTKAGFCDEHAGIAAPAAAAAPAAPASEGGAPA